MADPTKVKCKRCGEYNDKGINKCNSCGAFIKGNRAGENSRRRDGVKKALNDAILDVITIEHATELFRQFITDTSDKRTAFKAFTEWLNRTAGPVVKENKTELTVKEKEAVVESAQKFLDEMQKDLLSNPDE